VVRPPADFVSVMTVVSKGTPVVKTWGSGKVFAGFLGEIVEIVGFSALFAGCAVGMKCSAGDNIFGMFSADGTRLVHTIH